VLFDPSGRARKPEDLPDDAEESAKECGHPLDYACECEAYAEGDDTMPMDNDHAGIGGSRPAPYPIEEPYSDQRRAGIAGSRPVAMRQPITEHDDE
jgi:hypothetical protein